MRALKTILALPAAVALMLACTDGATTGQVNGTISSQLSEADNPEAAEVALLWATEDGDQIASSTTVSGDYPASFSLDLSGPPPEGALLASDPAAAIGVVVALEEGGDLEEDGVLGFSEELVLYLPAAAENLADLGLETGPIDAGYHLLRFVEPSEEVYAEIDACYDENIDALIGCEEGCLADEPGDCDPDDEACMDEIFAQEDACFEGCFADDPCESLFDDAFGIEVLPIDTPIQLVMVEDVDDDWGFEDDGCFDDAFGEADECFGSCQGDFDVCEGLIEDGASDEEIDACFEGSFDEGCFESCDVALDERLGDCDADFGGEPTDDGCFDDAFGEADECFGSCEGDFDACEGLIEDGASDEEIDACFEGSFDEGCFESCDISLEERLGECDAELPQPEPLDPEAEACLEPYWPAIDECFASCEERPLDDCDVHLENDDVDEAALDECLQAQDEDAWGCFEGCEALTMDAFNSCGVEYDC